MPIPQGYRLESHTNSGLVYGGLVVTLAPYLAGLSGAAAAGFSEGSGWLALPLAGPFIAMGGRQVDCNVADITYAGTGKDESLNDREAKCRKEVVHELQTVAVLTLDGLLQTTGAILTIAGLVSPSESLLRNDAFPLQGKVNFGASYYRGQTRLVASWAF
jgi:hypothetical protein